MTQIGEGIVAYVISLFTDKFLFASVESVTFDSGVKLFQVIDKGEQLEWPPAGTPHWSSSYVYAALYARQGGANETKGLKVKVAWSQKGCAGSAKLRGESSDGEVVIEGSFSISGDRGSAEVTCEFKKKPAVVTSYNLGLVMTWTVTAGGETAGATGGSPLRLFFTDAHPKPINWEGEYKGHFVQLAIWATRWAEGKSGAKAVQAAIWDKFSDGKAARVPHATGFSYWKTVACAQNLKELLDPKLSPKRGRTDYSRVYPVEGAAALGWSCRAIAHTFMECLALNGIQCQEVIPETAAGTNSFLVHNWESLATPVNSSSFYCAGFWVHTLFPPLAEAAPANLFLTHADGTTSPAVVDMVKRPGVPAQGQPRAPLQFSNHWIVLVGGRLYDTSYGLEHPNDATSYGKTSFGGWHMQDAPVPTAAIPSTWVNPMPGQTPEIWWAHSVDKHTVKLNYERSN